MLAFHLPTTVDKEPKFLSWALYWVAYLNSKLDLGSHLYILLISLAMIAYVSIGYWILLKKAPQTFRLKL